MTSASAPDSISPVVIPVSTSRATISLPACRRRAMPLLISGWRVASTRADPRNRARDGSSPFISWAVSKTAANCAANVSYGSAASRNRDVMRALGVVVHREEHVELRIEVVVDRRARDAGFVGDVLVGGHPPPELGERPPSDVEDALPGLDRAGGGRTAELSSLLGRHGRIVPGTGTNNSLIDHFLYREVTDRLI